jgi:hypothetical protein
MPVTRTWTITLTCTDDESPSPQEVIIEATSKDPSPSGGFETSHTSLMLSRMLEVGVKDSLAATQVGDDGKHRALVTNHTPVSRAGKEIN